MSGAASPLLLTWLIFTPAALALMLAALQRLLPSLSENAWYGAGLGGALFSVLLCGALWFGFDSETASPYQFVTYAPWIASLGLHFYVGVDGISLLFITLAAWITPIVLLMNLFHRRSRAFVFALLLLESCAFAIFSSVNLLMFTMFFQFALFCALFIVVQQCGKPWRALLKKRVLGPAALGALLLFAVLLTVQDIYHGQFDLLNFNLVNAPGGGLSGLLSVLVPRGGGSLWRSQHLLLTGFSLGVLLHYAPLLFYLRLARPSPGAPLAIAMITVGMLLPLGAYALTRFALPLFPGAAFDLAKGMQVFGVLVLCGGVFTALTQSRIKRLLVCATCWQLGLAWLGFFSFNAVAFEGGILQIVNIGICMGALFLLTDMLDGRRDASGALPENIAGSMPVFSALLVIALMSGSGVPLLNGFVSEFLVLLGVFDVAPALTVISAAALVLAAARLLWLLRRLLFRAGGFGDPEAAKHRALDIGPLETALALALVLPMFVIGIYPQAVAVHLGQPTAALLGRAPWAEAERAAEADAAMQPTPSVAEDNAATQTPGGEGEAEARTGRGTRTEPKASGEREATAAPARPAWPAATPTTPTTTPATPAPQPTPTTTPTTQPTPATPTTPTTTTTPTKPQSQPEQEAGN